MVWNYRLVKKAEDGCIGVHEVYYDENDKPAYMTQDVYTLHSDEDDYESLKEDLELILKHLAYDHSILEYPKDFVGNKY